MIEHEPIDFNDFVRAMIAGAEELDHRVVVLEHGEFITDESRAQMEADGYKFYCSPAADKTTGRRRVYYTRERAPALRM